MQLDLSQDVRDEIKMQVENQNKSKVYLWWIQQNENFLPKQDKILLKIVPQTDNCLYVHCT